MDQFYEQLVTASKTFSYKLVNVLVYVLGVLAVLLFPVNFLFSIILIIAAVFSFFFKKKLFVEYEYQFTNGEIDIDKISEMKKRSKMLSFHIKEVELMAPENSDMIKGFSNKPERIIECYPKQEKAVVYVAMVTGGSQRLQVKFTPDEEFLACCYKLNPKAVKR